MKSKTFAASLIAVAVSTVSTRAGLAAEFIWGVCGHPAGSYNAVPIETQIALLKELGAGRYRIDVGTDLDWLERVAAAAEKQGVHLLPILQPPVRLDETKWTLHRGGEFPGAKAKLGPVRELALHGRRALRVEYDLRAPTCRYVAAIRRLDAPLTLNGLQFAARTPCAVRFLIRIEDSTGQIHQTFASVNGTKDAWQQVDMPFKRFSVHYAGANDGQLHQPIRAVWIGVQKAGTGKPQGCVYLDDVLGVRGKERSPIDREFLGESLADIHRVSFDYARTVARRFRGRITHYELSNERDGFCMKRPPDPDGARKTDYDDERYGRVRELMRGLSEGVRAGDPNAKRVIDTAGWLHFGFLDRLRDDGVEWDVTAWHWYSEMGDPTQPIKSYSGTYVVLDRLAAYGKPIWFTEGDRRNGSFQGHEPEQAAYLQTFLPKLAADGRVQAYFVYELLDEPYFATGECAYGLVAMERDDKKRLRLGRRKPAFFAYQAAIRSSAK